MAIVNNVRNADGSTPTRLPSLRSNGGSGRRGGNLNSGGVVNAQTGMGTSLDHGSASIFTPTRIYWRAPLEILAVESWVAAKGLKIRTDDQFIRWRHFNSDDESAVEAMETAERELGVETALNQAMKAADQYGTGVVVMMSGESKLDEPLDLNRIREGDVTALHYFDRYDLSITSRNYDIYSPFYGQPEWYFVHPAHASAPFTVHRSRVLRFDGIRPPTRSGFSIYDQDFGVSVLVPIIVSLLEDQAGASAVAHMMQEASIPVLHIAGLREAIAGGGDPDEQTPEQIGAQINAGKSIYRLLMLDEPGREEFMRIAVQFGGLADIMDKFPERVAAALDIPYTRFMGNPPKGMNATGESDQDNYILMMEANREAKLRDVLGMQLDPILARHAGLKEAPEYEWRSLLELSDRDVAEAAKLKAEALQIAVTGYWMDEDEAREAINGDPVFGELPGPAPEAPEEPDPIELIEATAKAKAANAPPSTNGNGRQAHV